MKPRTFDRLLDQDFDKMSKRIVHFIHSYVSKSSAKGLVIGLSGGLDSSVVLRLAVNAISPSRILGLVIPSDATPWEDMEHAIELARSLKIEYKVIHINSLLEKYAEILPEEKKAKGNLMARIRMNILYYHANISSYIVAGTSDKSEIMIGYYTKWGDGAADILPIADLYKTEVRALAKYLGIPKAIVEKKSSPRLWLNHLAEDEIGVDYETIDRILYMLIDRKLKPRDVAKKLGTPASNVDKVNEMIKSNMHKRNTPPVAWQKI